MVRGVRWLAIALVSVAALCLAGYALARPDLAPRRSGQSGHGRSELAHTHWSVLGRSPLGPRFGPTVVWDGHELLELGGTATRRSRSSPRDSGAMYDPSRQQWRPVASTPRGLLTADAASVWTGRQVFVFGGPTRPHQARRDVTGLYDPASNRWTITAKAPLGPFAEQPTAVWTGQRVILAGLTQGPRQRLEMASYSPATDTWTTLKPPIRATHPPMAVAMVSTDDGVLLWSMWGRMHKIGPRTYRGFSGIDVYRLSRSGKWRGVTGRWPQHQTVEDPIFTGTKILLAPSQIWCGACSPPMALDTHGYLVNPRTLQRQAIPHGPLDDIEPQVIWTGDAELALNTGGSISGHENVRPGDIAIFNPRTRRWTRGPRAPKQLAQAPAVWTGQRLLALAQDGHLLAYGN